MNSKVLSHLLAVILALTTSPLANAQVVNPARSVEDWQGLQALKRGKKILVEYKSNRGSSFECKFVNINGTKLVVSSNGYQATLEQADIERVYELSGRWSRSRMAAIGAGVGLIVGTAVGSSIAVNLEQEVGHVNSEQDTFPAVAGFAIGTAAGAGIGALVGGKRRGKLIYQAK